ncbi:MAG TPA: ATP-dependent DNA helicase [Actinomycetota bacterium]|nr:ATP-dependent DNA helicase [Actinomycetota bacterium]
MSASRTFPSEIVEALGGREPTDEQWAAISMPLEPYVVVAGAGSGKTSVMAARIAYLALAALGRLEGEGVLPGNVLCLTFTNKATENLATRVRQALAELELDEGEEPVVMNYHSFAAQVLDRYGLLAGIEPGLRVLTTAQREELAARVLDVVDFEHIDVTWQPTVIDAILTLADQAANHRVEPERIVEFNRKRLAVLAKARSGKPLPAALERIDLANAVRAFHDLKRELGVIDFGDQITLAVDIVERFPQVGEAYGGRFRTVLLDEYQDTNVAQAELLGAVFGDGFPVTAVGDPDQNIYAWRGASLFNLLQFHERFRKADGSGPAKLPLYTNFRSGARILEAADRLLEPLPAQQRPDPDKRLVPWSANGEGEVELARFTDEVAEAAWIADRIVSLHDAGQPWSATAVLCRKSRLFTPLQEAFRERGIPAEIVGLAGLLKLPEVGEILAYARAVADPWASVALARILLGPRYRVGFKDLARVAAWVSTRNYEFRRTEYEDEVEAFLFAEALEHLDEVEHLSDEGRARLEEFRSELAELRALAGHPVSDFLAEILRRIGLLAELDANLERDTALATKRNLAAFLDEVNAFTPLEGDLTLRAFLDYVDVVEQTERQDWAPVQPSEEDSVKVMTIHQAKGLEFDSVFVPGLADGLLPDTTIQQNPAERGKSLDFELRGDAAILPKFDGTLSTFKQDLKRQEEFEERRTCYVALTRARERLFVTGAYWYGEGFKPKPRSRFLDELMGWGDETGRGVLQPEPAEAGQENPLLGYRERLVRDWPGAALLDETDDLFPQGWRRAALEAAATGGVPGSWVEALDESERTAYLELAKERRSLAVHLVEREGVTRSVPEVPQTLSVSGVIDYARCPKLFYWSAVRPLPRFSGPAARIGTEVHRWIERQSSGQATLIELDETPDLTAEELVGEPGKIERLRQAFLDSRFGGLTPLFAERQFLLTVEGFFVGGRIDAIYERARGGWEVVDYKTGRRPEDDPLAGLQLDLYALACAEVWGKMPEELTLTYLYLASGEEATRPAGDLEETRARVVDALRAIAAEHFDPTPGPQCRWCDFLPFCDAGKEHMSTR